MASKYYKLGKTATSFHDPKSGLNIAGEEIAEIDAAKARKSKTIRNAVDGGHIVEVEASEYKGSKLKSPNQDELLEKAGIANAKPGGKTGDGEPNKVENPNARKSASVSPNGPAPGAGGQGGLSSGAAAADDDDDEEQEEDSVNKKSAAKKSSEAPKKKKKKSKS